MAVPAYDDILGQIECLSLEDQLRLLEALASTIRREGLRKLQAAKEAQQAVEAASGYDPATDPITPFIGAFHSGVPDLADRHDDYLIQAYVDRHDDQR